MANAAFLLFGTFGFLMVLGVPIAFSIGSAAAVTFLLFMNFDQSMFIVAQQMASGLDSFTLLAIPFFILVGNVMNRVDFGIGCGFCGGRRRCDGSTAKERGL